MGVFDGGAVASHKDGVHDGQCTADAEGEAEEETDKGAGEKVHDIAMVCSVLPKGSLICASGERLSSYPGSAADFSGVVLIDAGY